MGLSNLVERVKRYSCRFIMQSLAPFNRERQEESIPGCGNITITKPWAIKASQENKRLYRNINANILLIDHNSKSQV